MEIQSSSLIEIQSVNKTPTNHDIGHMMQTQRSANSYVTQGAPSKQLKTLVSPRSINIGQLSQQHSKQMNESQASRLNRYALRQRSKHIPAPKYQQSAPDELPPLEITNQHSKGSLPTVDSQHVSIDRIDRRATFLHSIHGLTSQVQKEEFSIKQRNQSKEIVNIQIPRAERLSSREAEVDKTSNLREKCLQLLSTRVSTGRQQHAEPFTDKIQGSSIKQQKPNKSLSISTGSQATLTSQNEIIKQHFRRYITPKDRRKFETIADQKHTEPKKELPVFQTKTKSHKRVKRTSTLFSNDPNKALHSPQISQVNSIQIHKTPFMSLNQDGSQGDNSPYGTIDSNNTDEFHQMSSKPICTNPDDSTSQNPFSPRTINCEVNASFNQTRGIVNQFSLLPVEAIVSRDSGSRSNKMPQRKLISTAFIRNNQASKLFPPGFFSLDKSDLEVTKNDGTQVLKSSVSNSSPLKRREPEQQQQGALNKVRTIFQSKNENSVNLLNRLAPSQRLRGRIQKPLPLVPRANDLNLNKSQSDNTNLHAINKEWYKQIESQQNLPTNRPLDHLLDNTPTKSDVNLLNPFESAKELQNMLDLSNMKTQRLHKKRNTVEQTMVKAALDQVIANEKLKHQRASLPMRQNLRPRPTSFGEKVTAYNEGRKKQVEPPAVVSGFKLTGTGFVPEEEPKPVKAPVQVNSTKKQILTEQAVERIFNDNRKFRINTKKVSRTDLLGQTGFFTSEQDGQEKDQSDPGVPSQMQGWAVDSQRNSTTQHVIRIDLETIANESRTSRAITQQTGTLAAKTPPEVFTFSNVSRTDEYQQKQCNTLVRDSDQGADEGVMTFGNFGELSYKS